VSIEQGDIFAFDFGPRRNNLIEEPHFILVVQTDELSKLENYRNLDVVPITSKHKRSPTFVELRPSRSNSLDVLSYAITNQIFTIDKAQLGAPAGAITEHECTLVKQGLPITLDIQKEHLSG
jgi:mRNA-degrading endonuclease toxin of MazEF toxin-antitoxin module